MVFPQISWPRATAVNPGNYSEFISIQPIRREEETFPLELEGVRCLQLCGFPQGERALLQGEGVSSSLILQANPGLHSIAVYFLHRPIIQTWTWCHRLRWAPEGKPREEGGHRPQHRGDQSVVVLGVDWQGERKPGAGPALRGRRRAAAFKWNFWGLWLQLQRQAQAQRGRRCPKRNPAGAAWPASSSWACEKSRGWCSGLHLGHRCCSPSPRAAG